MTAAAGTAIARLPITEPDTAIGFSAGNYCSREANRTRGGLEWPWLEFVE
jgi:hypothetical protein